MICPQCGTQNAAEAVFCKRCGAPLVTQPPAPSGAAGTNPGVPVVPRTAPDAPTVPPGSIAPGAPGTVPPAAPYSPAYGAPPSQPYAASPAQSYPAYPTPAYPPGYAAPPSQPLAGFAAPSQPYAAAPLPTAPITPFAPADGRTGEPGGPPHPPRRGRLLPAGIVGGIIVVLLAALLVTQLRLGLGLFTRPMPTATRAAVSRTATPQPTATPEGPSPCPSQPAADARAEFPDLVFPSGTQTSGRSFVLAGPNAYSICQTTVSLPTDLSTLRSDLARAGWNASPKAPNDGAYLDPCTLHGVTCWAKPYAHDGRPRYVSLGSAQAGSAGTEVVMDLFFPPRLPANPCAGTFNPGPVAQYQAFLQIGQAFVPMPPVSLYIPDVTQQRTYDVCSSGTVDSIATFLDKYLPKQLFSRIAESNTSSKRQETWRWQASGQPTMTITWTVSDPGDWTIAVS